MSGFAERLKELRINKNLTQEELAKIFSSNRATLANWEIGRTKPDNDMLMRIASFFNVTTDYLLGRFVEQPSLVNLIDKEENDTQRERVLADMGMVLEDLGLLDCDLQIFAGMLTEIAMVIRQDPDKIDQWEKAGEYFLSLPSAERKKLLAINFANGAQRKRGKRLEKPKGRRE